jgi:aromatase
VQQQQLRSVEHTVDVSAAPQVPYRIVADVTRWPYLFAPTVHAERVAGDDPEEIIRIWAFADDRVRTWTSRRRLDPAALRVTFQQEVSQPPVASMGGAWTMLAGAGGGTRVVLSHDFAAIGDDDEKAAWIESVVDRNSGAELAGLKAAAELAQIDELLFTFDDTLPIRGPVGPAYDFICRSEQWPRRLPHVAALHLVEDEPGVQVMEMATRSPDGSTHTTKSVRICFPGQRIVYKQTVLPKIMAAHTGAWLFRPTAAGVEVTSRHTVLLRPETFGELLGAQATAADARRAVQHSLSTNSRTTLEHARRFVENGG